MSVPRFAIIGCGLIGRKRLATLPANSLRVACDVNMVRAEAMARDAGSRAESRVEETLRDDVDVVIVATTNSTLAPVSGQAIRAGKHVLIEKPAGISVREIEELERLAEDFGSIVRVGYNHRYHP